MTVQIKPLKGFKNPINDEMNTLSLLVKSDLDLKEHLSKAKEKLLTALTCIMENYNSNYIIYFYHKLQVLYENKTEYLSTKSYFTDLGNLRRDLNSSIEEVLKMTYGKKTSHFVNVTIKLSDDVIELSKDEFSNLNWKIRSNISKMNDEEILFVDNNNNKEPIKKDNDDVKTIKKDNDDVKTIKKVNDASDSLFIDDNDVKPIKKNEKDNSVKPIKKAIDDSLFIDNEENVKPFKKNKKVDIVKRIKKNNKKVHIVKPIEKAIDDSLFID